MAIPLYLTAFTFLSISFIAGVSEARDLRPSEHGLDYQNPRAPENTTPEMQSFFRGNSWSSSEVALPKAMNTTLQPSWWTRSGGEHARATASGGGDHIRSALLVASLVCGITGVALLIASALIYFIKFKNQRSSNLGLDCEIDK